MATILAIDDDMQILSIIKRALEKDCHRVDTFNNVNQVEENLLIRYDLILLDVMMPGIDGFTYCRKIREKVDCPIIFITAKTMEEDLTQGLAIGADDYIKKPFGLGELRARVNAHLRREQREYRQKLLADDFIVDLSEKALYLNQDRIKLTKSEYEICEFLIRSKGQVFSLEQILVGIYGYDSESDNSTIREHIKNIRAKLTSKGKNPIETVWGIGYKWV
ncbi:response regulator transcription factor [Anaerosporobacter sp.]